MSNRNPIRAAAQQLSRLPGVGSKTAYRLVYWLLRAPKGTAAELAEAIHALGANITECGSCRDLTHLSVCALCDDPKRDPSTILVVEEPQDVAAFERSGEYRGQYHILHGAISPLDGITPEQIRIRELLDRLRKTEVAEVILATDPNVEGDATALYLAKLLQPIGIKVTRLAHGISVGTEIEYADALSLAKAYHNRVAFQ